MDQELFHQHAIAGDAASIQALLNGVSEADCDQLLNLKTLDQEGNTPLHVAVIFRRTAVANLLVSKGASATVRNNDGMMPISYCQDKEMFHALLNLLYPPSDRYTNDDPTAPAGGASSSTNPPDSGDAAAYNYIKPVLVDLICRRKSHNLLQTDQNKRTLLHFAARYCRDAQILATLISLSENPVDLTLQQDSKRDTFLNVAAQVGNTGALEALRNLEYTAVINGETRQQLLCGAQYQPAPKSAELINNQSKLGIADSVAGKIHPDQAEDSEAAASVSNPESPALDALLHNRKDFFDKIVHMAGDNNVTVNLKSIMYRIVLDPSVQEDMLEKKLLNHVDREGSSYDFLLGAFPPTYLALYAGKYEVFDVMLKAGLVTANQWDEKYKRTCLHWAVLHNRDDIVKKLVSVEHGKSRWRPSMSIQDVHGKTASQLAFEQNNQSVLEMPAFKEHIEKLSRDREVYVQGIDAILVGAALISSVTFAGWLQLPSQSFKTAEMEIFWGCNSLSFYSAVAAMCVAIGALLPTPTKYVGQIVSQLRLAIVLDAMLLALSLAAVTCAFAAAGFAALRDGTVDNDASDTLYRRIMMATSSIGAIFCCFALLAFIYQLFKYVPSLPDVLFIVFPFNTLLKYQCAGSDLPPAAAMVSQFSCMQKLLGRVGDSSRVGYQQIHRCEIEERMCGLNIVPAAYKAPPDNEDPQFSVTKKKLLKKLLNSKKLAPKL